MAIDYTHPLPADLYDSSTAPDVLEYIRDNDAATARWLEGIDPPGKVAGFKRLNNGVVEEWNGTAWAVKPLAYLSTNSGGQVAGDISIVKPGPVRFSMQATDGSPDKKTVRSEVSVDGNYRVGVLNDQGAWSSGLWIKPDGKLYDIGSGQLLVNGSDVIPLTRGGTGATTAVLAMTNLGKHLPDGTIAAPGLAFDSEPGLGFYREGAGKLSIVHSSVRAATLNVSASTVTILDLYPGAAGGEADLMLNAQPQGTANFQRLQLGATASSTYIYAGVVGTGAKPPLALDAQAFNFTTGIINTIGISSSGTILHSNGAGLKLQDSAYPNIVFNTAGYQLVFVNSSGLLVWQKPGAVGLWSIDINGNSQIGGKYGTNGSTGIHFLSNTLTEYIALGDPAYGSQFEMAFLHEPGVFGGIRFLVASGQFKFSGDGTAQKSSGAGQWNGISDIRLKTNVKPLEYGLAEIILLNPLTYEMVGRDPTYVSNPTLVGIAAQDAEGPMPLMVYRTPDENLGEVLGIKPDYIQYALVNAVKELSTRVQALEGLSQKAST